MSDKTKILFVRPSLGMGGADRVTLNILKAFDRRKYECSLFLNLKKGEFLEDLPTDVEVHASNSMNVLTMIWPLAKMIRKNHFQVVYSTSGGTNVAVILSVLLSRKKVRTVISERVFTQRKNANKIKQVIWTALKKLTYNRANLVTAVSRELQDYLVADYNVAKEKTFVVNNPIIDKSLFELEKLEIDNELYDPTRPMILTAGRLIPVKNMSLLVKAFAEISGKTEACLYILGDGPERSSLEEIAKRLNVSERVKFLKFDKNPFRWMYRADIFVLPSNNEGMPGVLIQALACGAPCISTNSKTGPKELIRDGENGFLIDVGDQEGLKERMLTLLNDEDTATKFRQNAPMGLDRFKFDQAIESYFSIL